MASVILNYFAVDHRAHPFPGDAVHVFGQEHDVAVGQQGVGSTARVQTAHAIAERGELIRKLPFTSLSTLVSVLFGQRVRIAPVQYAARRGEAPVSSPPSRSAMINVLLVPSVTFLMLIDAFGARIPYVPSYNSR